MITNSYIIQEKPYGQWSVRQIYIYIYMTLSVASAKFLDPGQIHACHTAARSTRCVLTRPKNFRCFAHCTEVPSRNLSHLGQAATIFLFLGFLLRFESCFSQRRSLRDTRIKGTRVKHEGSTWVDVAVDCAASW